MADSFISRKVFSAFIIPIKYVFLCFFILVISGIYNIVFINKVLFRYIFVGGFAFIVDYSLLYLLTSWGGIHYIISATISFIVGLIVNYIISTHWIFKKSKLNNTAIEFLVYGIIGVIGLFLNDLLLYYFTDFMHYHYMVSKLIAAAIVMGWNFIGRRTILFKN